MTEIRLSSKGKPLLYHEGHIYNKFETKLNGAVTSWRCIKRCGGWVSQCGSEFTETKGHNKHVPSPTEQEVRKIKGALKERAISHPYEKPANTLAEVKRSASLHCVPHLPQDLSLKSTINRHGRENQNFQITGNTRATLLIPLERMKTHRGTNFLAYDSEDDDRIMIFATQQNLMELGLASVWMVDGTFKVAPEMYTQVYSVHAAIDGWVLPLAFGLLPDKRKTTYEKFFRGLVKASNGYISTPEVVITDFEMAEIGAIHKVFETASIQGCFFHLSQSLHRNLSREVIAKIKSGDKDLEHIVKEFSALAFLPPNHVEYVFRELVAKTRNLYPCMDGFVSHFEENYIGNSISGPRFQISLWSVYHRVVANFPRTNNSVEGYNNRMNNKINASHPGIGRLLDMFKDEQSAVEECFQLRIAAAEPPKKMEKYAQLNTRIVKLVQGYEFSKRLDFLNGIALNLMGIKSIKKRVKAAAPQEREIVVGYSQV